MVGCRAFEHDGLYSLLPISVVCAVTALKNPRTAHLRLHVITLPGEGRYLWLAIPPDLPNVTVHEEVQPPAIAEMHMHERKQWGMYWWDNYTAGSEYERAGADDRGVNGHY